MKHQTFEMKTAEGGEGGDPVGIVQKALGDLTRTLGERLEALEARDVTAPLAERLDKLEAKGARLDGGKPEDQGAPEKKAFVAYLRLGNALQAEDVKALTVSSDTQGGYFAPAEFSTEFIRDLVETSPVRSVASVRATSAPSVVYPRRTGITNSRWKGEIQGQEGSEPSLGQAEIAVKELNTFVDISNQLLADSGGQAETEVRLALSEDFGAKEAKAFVSGNGVLEPEGFLTAAGIAETVNGHATNLSADALITLLYALPASYRNAGAWAMNGTTLAAIRKLKDGQGNYLWQPSYQAGQPETILGRPVVEMLDMPDPVANATPIVYADWSGYRIVDRIGLSVLVNPYLLATNGLTRIHASRRVGGGVLQAAKFRKFRMAA